MGHCGEVLGEKPEAGEEVEVDEDAAEVEHGGGAAEQQHIEPPEQWLVNSHLLHSIRDNTATVTDTDLKTQELVLIKKKGQGKLVDTHFALKLNKNNATTACTETDMKTQE